MPILRCPHEGPPPFRVGVSFKAVQRHRPGPCLSESAAAGHRRFEDDPQKEAASKNLFCSPEDQPRTSRKRLQGRCPPWFESPEKGSQAAAPRSSAPRSFQREARLSPVAGGSIPGSGHFPNVYTRQRSGPPGPARDRGCAASILNMAGNEGLTEGEVGNLIVGVSR